MSIPCSRDVPLAVRRGAMTIMQCMIVCGAQSLNAQPADLRASHATSTRFHRARRRVDLPFTTVLLARFVNSSRTKPLSELNPTDRREDKRAWKYPKQKRH